MPFQKGHGKLGKGGGRKTKLQEFNLITRADKFAPIFWDKLEEWMNSGDSDKEKFAMQEFNKIQTKRIPQDITSGGKELPTPIMAINEVHTDNSNKQDSEAEQED